MDIQVRYDDQTKEIVVLLDGDLDLNSVNDFKRRMDESIEEYKAGVSIDCSALRYIDSTGLGVLVSILKKVKEYDGTMKILQLKPYLFKIFDVTGLTKVFEIEVA
ncbi:MAG: STAS domain-containing protein [Christensenella sp.]|uniref:STAS domain-containing protein n=1 Tax=Christensenella sp. TaxID=1935934 RepID=UPI002B1FBA5A|nr:STAS domain-containing protein [Christensenella sp.]MEA5004582.1 STAS domain-containing protein [Christensenella sp.]